MLVVNWEADCRVVAAEQSREQRIPGFELCDHTELFVGPRILVHTCTPRFLNVTGCTVRGAHPGTHARW